MGDAKRGGPYSRRKAEAIVKASPSVPVASLKVGDAVAFRDDTGEYKRMVVTEVTPTGLKGNVIPWSNYGS